MPTAPLIDLDKLLPPDKRVLLGGTEYKLPGDPPAVLWLRIQQLAASDGTGLDVDAIQDLYDRVLELFRVHQPAMEELPVGLVQLVSLLGVVYSGEEMNGAEPEDAPRPTTRPTRPPSTSRPTRSRSRSSSPS